MTREEIEKINKQIAEHNAAVAAIPLIEDEHYELAKKIKRGYILTFCNMKCQKCGKILTTVGYATNNKETRFVSAENHPDCAMGNAKNEQIVFHLISRSEEIPEYSDGFFPSEIYNEIFNEGEENNG